LLVLSFPDSYIVLLVLLASPARTLTIFAPHYEAEEIEPKDLPMERLVDSSVYFGFRPESDETDVFDS
jgi:hypothetical protein